MILWKTVDRDISQLGPGEQPSDTLTVPNALSALRLLLSPVLVALAYADLPTACLVMMVILLLMDWLDGKLAIWLKQKTVFGARLDSYADAVLYACVLLAFVLLHGQIIVREAVWIGLAVASYAVSALVCLFKFHRLPSYHNRLAKISWLLMLVAVISVFASWSDWPLRVAMAGVCLTNVEAIAITLLLPEWRANVSSLVQAYRHRSGTAITR